MAAAGPARRSHFGDQRRRQLHVAAVDVANALGHVVVDGVVPECIPSNRSGCAVVADAIAAVEGADFRGRSRLAAEEVAGTLIGTTDTDATLWDRAWTI